MGIEFPTEFPFEFVVDEKEAHINEPLIKKSINMRVDSLRIKNYKAFHDSGWIVFNKILLFYGENSAGKTAIFQPLMMLRNAFLNDKTHRIADSITDLDDSQPQFSDVINNRFSDEGMDICFGLIDNGGKKYVYRLHFYEENGVENEQIFLTADGEEQDLTKFCSVSNIFFASIIDSSDNGRALLLANIIAALKMFAENYVFMAPIRDLPRRDFTFSGKDINDLGIYGENAYNMLFSMLKDGELQNEYIKRWVGEFGYRFKWKSTGHNQGMLMLVDDRNGIESNIVDNGFGVGQSLPVIVAMATAKSKNVFIDSPAAFLQTKMQSIIADYVIAAAENNNMIAIESSSEYLLQRIRRRISEKKIDNNRVAVYYIFEEDGNAVCDLCELDSKGNFVNTDSEFSQFFSSAYQDVMEMMKGYIEQGDLGDL